VLLRRRSSSATTAGSAPARAGSATGPARTRCAARASPASTAASSITSACERRRILQILLRHADHDLIPRACAVASPAGTGPTVTGSRASANTGSWATTTSSAAGSGGPSTARAASYTRPSTAGPTTGPTSASTGSGALTTWGELNLVEGHGDILLTNAQKAAHADDNRHSLTIAV